MASKNSDIVPIKYKIRGTQEVLTGTIGIEDFQKLKEFEVFEFCEITSDSRN